MTSSLVGSEMCIRDRARTQGPGGWTEEAVGPEGQRKRHQRFLARSQAVSYTHLTLPTICSV
eukprot:8837474-Prorocentrum_lima.AAC.1